MNEASRAGNQTIGGPKALFAAALLAVGATSLCSHAFELTADASCVAGTANAITTADVTDSGTGAATACYGAYQGNNVSKASLLFNEREWELAGSTEEPIGDLTADTQGGWQFTGMPDAGWDSYWLVIKQASSYAAWYFEVEPTTQFRGTWLAAWAPGSTTDFSHMEFYAGTATDIAEPGTLALLGLGLLGLVWIRRRT